MVFVFVPAILAGLIAGVIIDESEIEFGLQLAVEVLRWDEMLQ